MPPRRTKSSRPRSDGGRFGEAAYKSIGSQYQFLMVDFVTVVRDRVFGIHTPSLQTFLSDKSFRHCLRTRHQGAVEINVPSNTPSAVLRQRFGFPKLILTPHANPRYDQPKDEKAINCCRACALSPDSRLRISQSSIKSWNCSIPITGHRSGIADQLTFGKRICHLTKPGFRKILIAGYGNSIGSNRVANWIRADFRAVQDFLQDARASSAKARDPKRFEEQSINSARRHSSNCQLEIYGV